MNFPTRQTMTTFIDIAKQKECFYKVRRNAIERLAKVTLLIDNLHDKLIFLIYCFVVVSFILLSCSLRFLIYLNKENMQLQIKFLPKSYIVI